MGCQSHYYRESAKCVLTDLHVGHPGVHRMKSLAHGYVYWPGLDADIEDLSKLCVSCMENDKTTSRAPLRRWEHFNALWRRVHIDYAGPVE